MLPTTPQRAEPAPEAAPAAERLLPSGWLGAALAALIFRLLWLIPAWSGRFIGDEGHYLKLAAKWADGGGYDGQWPPLHPFFASLFYRAFSEDSAVGAARVAMSLLAVWSGIWLMVIAKRTVGERPALLTGWIWALYLPLIPFAHVLISEGLQMALLFPAIAVFLGAKSKQGTTRSLIVAGALLGLACLTREASAGWLLAIGLWALQRHGLGGAARLGMAAAVVIGLWAVPHSLRIGSVQPLGRTAGLNAYQGWNAHYVNFDLTGTVVPKTGVPGAEWRQRLIEPPPGVESWTYEFLKNPNERDRAALHKGIDFALANPGFMVRSRVVKAADLASPMTELVRCLHLRPPAKEGQPAPPNGGYGHGFDGPYTRTAFAVASTLSLVLVTLLALLGVTVAAGSGRIAPLLAYSAGATAPFAGVVAMVRLRAPFEALLILAAASAAVALKDRKPLSRRPGPVAALVTLGTGVLFLWILSIPPLVAVFEKL